MDCSFLDHICTLAVNLRCSSPVASFFYSGRLIGCPPKVANMKAPTGEAKLRYEMRSGSFASRPAVSSTTIQVRTWQDLGCQDRVLVGRCVSWYLTRLAGKLLRI